MALEKERDETLKKVSKMDGSTQTDAVKVENPPQPQPQPL